MCPSGEVARTGKDAVSGNGVLWRTGRRAGHEGVPSQNAALVFQSVLSGAVDCADCPAGDWCVPVGAMNYIIFVLNIYAHVELLIDLLDERYTRSDITDEEYDTDVKKVAEPVP